MAFKVHGYVRPTDIAAMRKKMNAIATVAAAVAFMDIAHRSLPPVVQAPAETVAQDSINLLMMAESGCDF